MKPQISRLQTLAYRRLIRPRSLDQDSQRREFILNVLLCGLLSIASLAFLVTIFHHFAANVSHDTSSVISSTFFLLIVAALLKLSRRGHYQATAYIFLGVLGLAITQLLVTYGFELPIAELAYSLIIVIAGVLLTARVGLLIAGLASLVVLGMADAQVMQLLHPNTSWVRETPQLGDAVGYVAIFAIMGVVSWLANREIDRSLQRARRSEADLQQERDSLEIKVIERTKQLEELQLARLLEVQRFAEFGRLSGGLLHEVANPLTAASLYLEQLSGEQPSELVQQARKNLHYLERYLEAARKQLRHHGEVRQFSVRSELRQVIGMLGARARAASVSVVLDQTTNYKLSGDPVKFSQLTANLIANAIDAYDKVQRPERQVLVTVQAADPGISIQVTDWGRGIRKADLAHILEPFYSTKIASNRGLGLGLAIVKQYVEEDFGGSLSVTSSRTEGTRFTAILKGRERA